MRWTREGGRRSWRTAALAAAAAVLVAGAAGAVSAVVEGARAPDFSAPLLSGSGNLSLSAHRGKVVYLDFWASWCPPCLVSLPLLEELRQEFPVDEFAVVAVNVDREPKKALAFLNKHPVGYKSASDPDGRIPETFGIETMPTSFLIDRNGVVRHVHRGFRRGDEDLLRERIRALLAGK
jgi:thiol-disulfide isomerase/thioredoxin